MKKTLFGLIWLGWLGGLQAQELTISRSEGGQARPVAGIWVGYQYEGHTGQLQANAAGQVILPGFPVVVQVQLAGYQTYRDTLLAPGVYRHHLEALAYTLAEEVITAQYTPGSPEAAVHRIRVIDQERIRRQGAANLAELLSQELNIRIQQDPVLGAGISLQGLPGSNVKILVDGVPVIGRLDGSIDLSQLPLSQIERVEVVEGPMSSVYGTDAAGGVINLITRRVPDAAVAGSVQGMAEPGGWYNGSFQLSTRQRGHQFALSGSRNLFRGWSSPASPNVRSDEWKPRLQYGGRLVWEHRVRDIRLRAHADAAYDLLLNQGEVVRTSYFARAIDEYFYTLRTDAGLDAAGYLSPAHHLQSVINFNRYSRTRDKQIRDMVTLTDQPSPDPADHGTDLFYAGIFRHVWSYVPAGGKVQTQAGVDIQGEMGEGLRLAAGDRMILDAAVFASAEYRPGARLTLRPALRWAWNNRYGAPLTPSFNLRWRMQEAWTLRAGYGRGFRAPGLKELYLFFVDINHNIRGNEALQAEISHHLDTYLTWQHRGMEVTAGVFANRLTNQIELALVDADQALYQYVNLSRTATGGTQLDMTATRQGWRVTGGLSATARLAPADITGPQWTWTPEVRLQPAWSHARSGWGWAVFYKYTGALPLYLTNLETETLTRTWAGDYHLMDASVSWRKPSGRISVTAGAKNLLNVTRVTGASGGAHSGGSSQLVGRGRTFFLSAEYQLFKP